MDDLQPDPTNPGPASSVISWSAHDFPWWLVGMVSIIAGMVVLIVITDGFRDAFGAIFPWPLIDTQTIDIPVVYGSTGQEAVVELVVSRSFVWTRGIVLTLILTVGSFVASLFLGLFIGLGRIAEASPGATPLAKVTTTFVRNLATLYIEFVRGIPMLVFIFVVALVLVPDVADLFDVESRSISNAWRGSAALAFFYAAFIAEVFRAGIQSVPVGQVEAGKAVGLTGGQIMRTVVLPQAVRNMLPALGNDLISLMKDTSLVSVLAVRELTQMARLYTGSTFRFREGFFISAVLYVSLTLVMSLLLRWYEKRIAIPGR